MIALCVIGIVISYILIQFIALATFGYPTTLGCVLTLILVDIIFLLAFLIGYINLIGYTKKSTLEKLKESDPEKFVKAENFRINYILVFVFIMAVINMIGAVTVASIARPVPLSVEQHEKYSSLTHEDVINNILNKEIVVPE